MSDLNKVLWALVLAPNLVFAQGLPEYPVEAAGVKQDGGFLSINGTIVELKEASIAAQMEGALYEINIHNKQVNSSLHNMAYYLEVTGMRVRLDFKWNVNEGNDGFKFEPQPGYIAIPDEVDVPEDSEAVVLIYPLVG